MQGYSSNEQCLSESRLPSRNPRPPIARTRKRRQEKKKIPPNTPAKSDTYQIYLFKVIMELNITGTLEAYIDHCCKIATSIGESPPFPSSIFNDPNEQQIHVLTHCGWPRTVFLHCGWPQRS